jgi:hypothetical protein
MRRMLVVCKSKLNVMLKIKEEKGTESLEIYVKSTWPVISWQRRIGTKWKKILIWKMLITI